MNNTQIVSAKYQEASIRFRKAWLEYVGKEELVKSEIINMVRFLEKDGYTRTQAIKRIVEDHKDLKGFSRAQVYRELPKDMKNTYILKNKKLSNTGSNVSFETFEPVSEALEEFRQQKGRKVQNNVTEDNVDKRCQHNVLEDSSTTGNHELLDELEPVLQDDEDDLNEALDAVYDVDPIEAEPHIQYDDPQRIIKQYEQQNIELEKKYEDLEEKYNQIITPFEYRQTAIVNGQELPFLVKVNPYKREVKSIELDQNEVKKTK